MLSIQPLPQDHILLPLVQWALCLVTAKPNERYDALLKQLSMLAGDSRSVELQKVVPLLPSPLELLNISNVLLEITHHAHDAGCRHIVTSELAELSFDTNIVDAGDLPWELREQTRMLVGDYKPVPWDTELAAIPGHYAHLSTSEPGLIAYTADAAKGAADKQTPIRAGRYLTRFYPHLSESEIRRLAESIPKPAELKFARTADEIEDIYLRGPNSCMAHDAAHYDSPCHPVRVYGESDLSLAYAVVKSGCITARALVWPEHKRFGRIYGDTPLLERLLTDSGYSHGLFTDARIRRIPVALDDPARVVMPYLDGNRSFDVVDDNWLSIGGPFEADTTNGIAPLEERSTCDNCGDRCDDVYEVGCDIWCSDCRDGSAFCSDWSSDSFPESTMVRVVVQRSGDTNIFADWAECERDEHATFCHGSNGYYQTNRFPFVALKNGEHWVDWYFEEFGDPDDAVEETSVTADNDNQATGERAAA